MKELDDIPCFWIGRRLRWSGIVVTDMKEKYGTWRVYCHFGPTCFHELTHNGHSYIRYTGIFKWLYYRTYTAQTVVFGLLGHVLYPLQRKWYRHVYKKAIEKFPEERQALLHGADYRLLLIGL
jgi:hypothetical protein